MSTDQSNSYNVVLIDGSLSMLQVIDEKTASTRADVAQATVLSMLKQQDDDFKIYSFGNVNDDCVNNIAELYDADAIKNMTLGSPLGRTPLVQSILNILEQYKYYSKLRLTVVTDGIDNCDDDSHLDSLRSKMQALNNDVELTIDIVGLNIPQHHSQSLREIAALSNGGRLVQVNDAMGLRQVLSKESYGFIQIDRPIEIDFSASWRLYENNKRVAHLTDVGYAFNRPIKFKSNVYSVCLVIDDEVFVSPIVVEAGEIHRIKSLRRQQESKSSVLQAIKEAIINVFK